MSENHAADDGSKFAIAVLLFAVTHCVYSVVGRCFEIWQVIRADLYFCLQFMDVNARLLFSGFSTLCVAVLGGYFVRSHRARPNDSVLSQFCREPYKVRAEADAPWGALAAKPLRTRSVPASASPQSRRRALTPCQGRRCRYNDTFCHCKLSAAHSLAYHLLCGCAGVPKSILSFKGLQSTLAQMIRRRTIFGNNILSPRNGSKIKPANYDICRQ